MTQNAIEELKPTIAATPNPSWPFICAQPTVTEEEIQNSTTLIAINTFIAQQYLTPLASAEY